MSVMIHLDAGKLSKFCIVPFSCHCTCVISPSQNLFLINVYEIKKNYKDWGDG